MGGKGSREWEGKNMIGFHFLQIMKKRPDLRLIVSSATLDAEVLLEGGKSHTRWLTLNY